VNAREAVGLVLRREITTRMRSKAYLFTTLGMVIGVIAISFAFKLVGGSSASDIGVLDPSTAAPLRSVASALGEDVNTRTVPNQATGERQVRDGDLDALVVGSGASLGVVVKKNVPDDLRNALNVLVRQQVLNGQIVKAGGDPAAVNRAVAAASVQVRSLEPADNYRGQRIAVGSIAIILVFIALQIYGQSVAQGVVEEKASRIVEILLTAIRPWELMLGKVIGIGAAGLAQLLATVIAGVGATLATGVDIPTSLLTEVAGWALVWFVLGFFAYALILAAMGSLVSRQEEVGGVVAPTMMLLVLPYILGISILPTEPDNGLLRLLSLIPLFSPTLMPMRAALGAPAWEIWLSIALTMLLIVVLVRLSGRVYRNAVLRMGTRIKLRDALRAA
jgi:ABC-2 type transport system permease protein